jgi:fermentation-respiration switch protein FrsA (DUF1100 family)
MTGLMTSRRALGWLAVAAALAILWLAGPFVPAVLGGLTAFTLEPNLRGIGASHRTVIPGLADDGTGGGARGRWRPRCAGIDIAAERIVTSEIASHALQGAVGGARCRA